MPHNSVDLHPTALGRLNLVELLQPQLQLSWKPLVALLADRLEVDLVELGLLLQELVAGGAGKVVRAPGLVQGVNHVALDDLRERILGSRNMRPQTVAHTG